MEELWKDIPSYEGIYQVSNLGRIKKVPRELHLSYKNSEKEIIRKCTEKILITPVIQKRVTVVLYRGKEQSRYSLGKIVAKVFIDNPSNFRYVAYKDKNYLNNTIDNIYWTDKSYINDNNMCNKKRIVQLTKDNEIIKIWPSISEAGKTLNISIGNISSCASKKINTAGGFKWRLENGN